MSCGGNHDGSKNRWGEKITDFRATMKSLGQTPPSTDQARIVFHALTRDLHRISPSTDSDETRDRAAKMLDIAFNDPDMLPGEMWEARATLRAIGVLDEPSLSELPAKMDSLAADPTADPDDLEEATTEYYDRLASEDYDDDLPSTRPALDLPDAGIVDGNLVINGDPRPLLYTIEAPENQDLAVSTGLLLTGITSPTFAGAVAPTSLALSGASGGSLLTASGDGALSGGMSVISTDPGPPLTVGEQFEAALTVREAHDGARAVVSDIGADLAARIDAQQLRAVKDNSTGVTITPAGGADYSGWQHDNVRAAIGDAIASREGLDPQDVTAVIAEYSEYAGADYYRTTALKGLGLKARDFANMKISDRRVVVTNPALGETPMPASLGRVSLVHGATLQRSVDSLPALRQRIADMPLDQAVREYAALDASTRIIGRAAASLETSASVALTSTGADSIMTRLGEYKAYTTAGGDVWDPKVRTDTLAVVATKTGRTPAVVAQVTDAYDAVAHIGRWKIKGLKAAGLDPTAYRTTKSGNPKIGPAKKAEGE